MTEHTQPPVNPSSNFSAIAPGLPPVQPPSGRHIVQMFIVPGLIVSSIVGVLMLFTWMFGGPRTPEEWLDRLKDPNPEVRWRAAADLAQVLLRDKELSANADFALELAILLDDALHDSVPEEKVLADRLGKITEEKERKQEWQKIKGEGGWSKVEAQRNRVIYLGSCLGSFTVPVGVPLLKQMAEQEAGIERRGLARQRWRAVLALANLGQRLSNDHAALPDLRKDLIESQLEKASVDARFSKWAGPALQNMKNRRTGHPDMMGLDVTFEKITDFRASDPFLRVYVAGALHFWSGTDAENQRVEQTLLRLTYDPGTGTDLLLDVATEDSEGSRPIAETVAIEVRFMADRALAYRGSKKVRLDMLADLLDESYLREHLKVRDRADKEQIDARAVAQTIIDALAAIGVLHDKRPEMELSSVRPAIDMLADNSNKAIQTAAKKLQKTLDTK